MTDQKPIDGVQKQQPAVPSPKKEEKNVSPREKSVRRAKAMMLAGGGIVVVGYLMWCMLLISLFPARTPELVSLESPALLSLVLGGMLFVAIGAIGFMRIQQVESTPQKKLRALIFLALPVIPGLGISLLTAFIITRSPALGVGILTESPYIAPTQINFSVEEAAQTLANRGTRTVEYRWDIGADGEVEETTVQPLLTVNYQRSGVFAMRVVLVGSDGSTQVVSRRFVIEQSAFGVNPNPSVVERPIAFDVSNITENVQDITLVEWDFDNDGTIDEQTDDPQTTYTFFTIGEKTVSARITLANQTQQTLTRTITVQEPTPLPFPVELQSSPSYLVSPAPLAVLFSIETEEDVAQVEWDFGDGEQAQGREVLHEYDAKGNFLVTATVRNSSGTVARLDRLVEIVDTLQLSDLSFDSTIELRGNVIEGSVPMRLTMTPKTSTSFVTFRWEAPEASEVGSTDGTLQAVYREEGEYNVILLAQDAGNRALRRTFTVQVNPPDSVIDFKLDREGGVAPLTVRMDASISSLPEGEIITGYEWQCKANDPFIPSGAASSCTYNEPGNYRIALVINTQQGQDYTTEKFITVRPPALSACFLASRTSVTVGNAVAFDPTCAGGTWTQMVFDFGDGTQIEWARGDANPVHVYRSEGAFTVTQTLSNTQGARSARTATITVLP